MTAMKLRIPFLLLPLACATLMLLPAPARAAGPWAPAASAPVHPGVMTYTSGGQCTANFVYVTTTKVYLGQAAHCGSTGNNTQTNGCTTGSVPLGTPVEVDGDNGRTYQGKLAYSSWITMQALHETNAAVCQFNDLALVELTDASPGSFVNPSVPAWGGPVGLTTTTPAVGSNIYTYGNSSLRLGITLLSPKNGTLLSNDPSGWSHTVRTYNPGIPGDSGSGFLDATGHALGVLSTLNAGVSGTVTGPNGVWNAIGDVAKELAYLNANGGLGTVSLEPGTQPFNPSLVNLLNG